MTLSDLILLSLRGMWAWAVSCTMAIWDCRENHGFVWSIYVNLLLMGCLPGARKSDSLHSVEGFKGNHQTDHLHLPQELAEIIIGYLSTDFRSLGNCALVCKSWTHPSRIHLFRSVVLNFYDPLRPELGHYHNASRSILRKSTALLKCLDRSPHLAWYISSIEIRNCWCIHSTSRGSREALRMLARLLPKLRHITRFVLRNTHWESLSEVRHSINRLLALPTLRHISLDTLTIVTYKDLADILSFSQNLRTLVLNDITCIKSHPIHDECKRHWNTTMSAQSIDLSELRIDSPGLSPHLDWLCSSQSPFNVGNIQRLHVSARSLSQTAVSDLLHNNCSTLQRLELGATLTNDLRLHMNLGMMANIRTLTLRLVNIDASSANAIFHPLDISQTYALEEVTIELLSPALIWRDWSELDASLSQTKFARLRYVQIQVPPGIWRWTNPNFEKFKAQFPAMAKSGILRIRTD